METKQRQVITRYEGGTSAERYLKQLCDGTFLSLWSYSGIYRDQGNKGKGHGKEICDLIVVFQNHVIIFSDKDCQFPNTGNLEVDWSRWYRKAVESSANQLFGAERWLKSYPDRVFLDRACTVPFPIELPAPDQAYYHLVLVAHDVSPRCRAELGGSGSLMIVPTIVGREHCKPFKDNGKPFVIGRINDKDGYVHVLDDTSLDVLLTTLDTVTDFIEYLTKKEAFILSGKLIVAAGEDELLAYYFRNLDKVGKHDFMIPSDIHGIVIEEGFWDEFQDSPQRKAQFVANEISYVWDGLIEKFSYHILTATQHFTTNNTISQSERGLRFLAGESRTRRRMLSDAIIQLINKTPANFKGVRIFLPSNEGDPYYIFLVLPHIPNISYENYREGRRKLLESYIMVTKVKYPEATDLVGIATESGQGLSRSEDLLYFNARSWTETMQNEAESIQRDFGFLQNFEEFRTTVHEFPVVLPATKQNKTVQGKKMPRNERCPCGSGKKYKQCCGRR